jgi:hypothetical protein
VSAAVAIPFSNTKSPPRPKPPNIFHKIFDFVEGQDGVVF